MFFLSNVFFILFNKHIDRDYLCIDNIYALYIMDNMIK